MSLNELNNTRVRHKVGTGSLPSVSSGSIVYSADSGRMYLDTPDGRIELHSDLPYGTLGSENNNVTVDKNIVLSTGTSIRVYGNHIPTTLNVNSTGSVNVKLNGSTLSTSKSLDGNTVTIYTYVQSESAWVVGTSTSESGGGGGGTSDLVLVNAASTESEGVKIDHVTLSSICSAYASGKIVKLVIPAAGAVFDLDFAIVEDVRADVLFSVMTSEKEKAYLLFSDDPDEDEAVADFSSVTYQIEGSRDPGIRIVDSNFGDIRFYGGFQETVTDLFKGKISTTNPIGYKLLLTYCDISKGILLSRTGYEIRYLILLSNGSSNFNYYIKIYHTDSSTLPTGEKRLFTYEDDNQNTNYVNLSYTPVANFQTSGNEPSLSSIQIGGTKYKIAQTDWDQNNSSSADYIKNRPFYENSVSVTVDPSEYVFLESLGMCVRKISDEVLTLDQLRLTSGTYYYDGTTYTFSNNDSSLGYAEMLPGINGVLAQGGQIPLLASSEDFSSIGADIDSGTYAMAIGNGGESSFYSRLITVSYTSIKTIEDKFINSSTINRLVYTISPASYKKYSYDFRDDKVRYLEDFAFVESNCTDIVIPRVESIGDFAFLGSSLGRKPGRLLDLSYCHFLNHIGSAIAGISLTTGESSRYAYNYYGGLTGIAIWGNEKRDYSQLTISKYALNGTYHGVLVLNSPYDSDHSAFLSTMNAQGIYVAFSNNLDADISEMNTIVDGLTDISTISDSWDTIISNINSGNYSQYLLGTKKIYYDIVDTDGTTRYTKGVAYLQCVGTDKDVDSSDNTIKTTWVFRDIEFGCPMTESQTGYSWADSYLRSFLSDSTKFRMYYLDSNNQEVDFSNIVVPAKKTYLNSYSYDKYWIPSTRELNASDLESAESSGCIYDQYYTNENTLLYNCNSSRIKWGRSSRNPDSTSTAQLWWTRTGDNYNNTFLYVNERGEINDENNGELYSNMDAGIIVGMCI